VPAASTIAGCRQDAISSYPYLTEREKIKKKNGEFFKGKEKEKTTARVKKTQSLFLVLCTIPD